MLLFRHRVALYRAYVFLFFYLSFFRTLSEKTAEPVIAKPEHKPSVLRKLRRAFSVLCPLLNFRGQNNTF